MTELKDKCKGHIESSWVYICKSESVQANQERREMEQMRGNKSEGNVGKCPAWPTQVEDPYTKQARHIFREQE